MPRLVGTNSRATAAPIPCASTGRTVLVPSGAVDLYLTVPELRDARPVLDGMLASGYLSYRVEGANDDSGPVPASGSRTAGALSSIARVLSLGTPAAKSTN